MHGRLFTFFDTAFPSYFMLIVVGFVFATTIAALTARRLGQNPDVIVDLGLFSLIFGFAGARLLHVFADGLLMDYVHLCTDPSLVDWHITQAECRSEAYLGAWDVVEGVCHPTEKNCFAWLQFWNGGFTFYGGFIGAAMGALWLFKRDRFPLWRGLDIGGAAVPIGQGFGRLGCLLAGCCFGAHTDHPVGLIFPPGSPASDWQAKHDLLSHHLLPSLSVHPTQVYEAAAAFLVATVGMLSVAPRKRYDGQVLVFVLTAYGAARFALEFVRSDDRGGLLLLSTSQWISLTMIVLALVMHRYRMRSVARLTPMPQADK